jgi:hypothetical protein
MMASVRLLEQATISRGVVLWGGVYYDISTPENTNLIGGIIFRRVLHCCFQDGNKFPNIIFTIVDYQKKFPGTILSRTSNAEMWNSYWKTQEVEERKSREVRAAFAAYNRGHGELVVQFLNGFLHDRFPYTFRIIWVTPPEASRLINSPADCGPGA